MRRKPLIGAFFTLAAALATACLGGSGPGFLDDEPDKTPPDLGLDDGGFFRSDADVGDPFSIEGLSPSHGPFTGGTRAHIAGRGFSSKLRVFVGGTEVEPGALLASDPTRAAIETPPGPPGFVDVRIRDEATANERVLKNGFYYDAFVVQPSSGATSGGTRIAITGSGTAWTAGTKVAIGGIACVNVAVPSSTRIECETPPSTPGVKDVTVTTPDTKTIQARDAYTYSDSTDGYRGGLSGGAFAGRVKVLAFDAWVGTPIGGAYVVAGPSITAGVQKRTSASGVAEIDALPGTSVTVTVAADCHQPMTFVDVPVDTVTVYLNPVLDLSCAKGDPPSGGGRGGRYGGLVEGNLVFPGAGEFEKVGWTTVPSPTRPTERRAAYVFDAAPSPNATFQLPPASEAITPDSPASSGSSGFAYSLVVYPGNVTVYVVAGLEDRSLTPPRFVPYAMGVARGITVPAQTRVQGVDIKMDVLFDHQVTLAPVPPAPGPRGPDRLSADVAVTLGAAGYAILPQATRVAPLPFSGNLPFVGMPSLDRGLSGEQYVLGAVAATGPDLQRPASVVSRIRTTNANTPVAIGGFLGVPVLGQPGAGTWTADDTAQSMHVSFSGASGPVDLTVVDVASGNGLVTWTIVAPGAKTDFDVPDLRKLSPAPPKNLGLVSGAIRTSVSVARIEELEYGKLRYGHLAQGAWNAYAFDSLSGAF